jgi:hypothetical protein
MTDTPPDAFPSQPAFTPLAPGWYPVQGGGESRYWDGNAWTGHQSVSMVVARVKNGVAVASLVLGIVGFVLMAIPFFIGWFLGGIPDILAIIFGIVGLTNTGAKAGVGKAPAIVGLILGAISILSAFLGAGSLW